MALKSMNQRTIPGVPFLILWGIILFMKFYASEKSHFLFFFTENNISTKITWSQVFLVKLFSSAPVPKLFRAQPLVDWCFQCFSSVYVAKSTGSPKEQDLAWVGAKPTSSRGPRTYCSSSANPRTTAGSLAADTAAAKHLTANQLAGQGECTRDVMFQLERDDFTGLQNG